MDNIATNPNNADKNMAIPRGESYSRYGNLWDGAVDAFNPFSSKPEPYKLNDNTRREVIPALVEYFLADKDDPDESHSVDQKKEWDVQYILNSNAENTRQKGLDKESISPSMAGGELEVDKVSPPKLGLHGFEWNPSESNRLSMITHDKTVADMIHQKENDPNAEKSFAFEGFTYRKDADGQWRVNEDGVDKPAYIAQRLAKVLEGSPEMLEQFFNENYYFQEYFQNYQRAKGQNPTFALDKEQSDKYKQQMNSNNFPKAQNEEKLAGYVGTAAAFGFGGKGAGKVIKEVAKKVPKGKAKKWLDISGTVVDYATNPFAGATSKTQGAAIALGSTAGMIAANNPNDNSDQLASEFGGAVGGAAMGQAAVAIGGLIKKGFTEGSAKLLAKHVYPLLRKEVEPGNKLINPTHQNITKTDAERINEAASAIIRLYQNGQLTKEQAKNALPAIWQYTSFADAPKDVQQKLATAAMKADRSIEVALKNIVEGIDGNQIGQSPTIQRQTQRIIKEARGAVEKNRKATGYHDYYERNKSKSIKMGVEGNKVPLEILNNMKDNAGIKGIRYGALDGVSDDKLRTKIKKFFSDLADSQKPIDPKEGKRIDSIKADGDVLARVYHGVSQYGKSIEKSGVAGSANVKEMRGFLKGQLNDIDPEFGTVTANYQEYKNRYGDIENAIYRAGKETTQSRKDEVVMDAIEGYMSKRGNADYMRDLMNPDSVHYNPKLGISVVKALFNSSPNNINDGVSSKIYQNFMSPTNKMTDDTYKAFNLLPKRNKDHLVSAMLSEEFLKNADGGDYASAFGRLMRDPNRKAIIDSIRGKDFTKELSILATMNKNFANNHELIAGLPKDTSFLMRIVQGVFAGARKFNIKVPSAANNFNQMLARRVGKKYLVIKHLADVFEGMTKREQYVAIPKIIKNVEKTFDEVVSKKVISGEWTPEQAAKALFDGTSPDFFVKSDLGKQVAANLENFMREEFKDEKWAGRIGRAMDSRLLATGTGGVMKPQSYEGWRKMVEQTLEEDDE